MYTKTKFIQDASILGTLFDGYLLATGESFHNDSPINKYIEVKYFNAMGGSQEEIKTIKPNQIFTNYNPLTKAKVLTNI